MWYAFSILPSLGKLIELLLSYSTGIQHLLDFTAFLNSVSLFKDSGHHWKSQRSLKILSIKANRTLAKTQNQLFFRMLEINQRLTAIWGMIIQEKQPNLHKNNELWGILICPIPICPYPVPPVSKKQSQSSLAVQKVGILPKHHFWKKGYYWT